MLTEKDYCDYETCVALKELGYKIPTSAYYMPKNNQLFFVSNPFRGGYVIDCFFSHNSLREDTMTHDFIDAPTMWEAQRWLREEKKLFVEITIFEYTYGYRILDTQNVYYDNEHVVRREGCLVGSYEEALLEGIKECIKLLNKNI